MAGGIVLYGLLYYPCYYFLPGQYINSWFASNENLAYICLLVSVLVLIVIGILGGRWSGLDEKKSFLGGAAAGGIAAILSYGLIISPATAVIGNKDILRYGLIEVGDELSLAWLVFYGVSGTLWWGAIGFWASLLAGLVLGGIGGWLAEPVPDPKSQWAGLFFFIDPIMMFASFLVFFMTYPTYRELLDVALPAVSQLRFSPPYPFALSITLIITASYAWFLFWQLKLWMDLRNFQAAFSVQRLSWALSSFAALVMPFFLLFLALLALETNVLLLLPAIISVVVGVLTFRGTFWKKRQLPMPAIQNPLTDFGLMVGGALVLSTFMTMTIMTGNLAIALHLVTITITAIGPLTEGFSANSSSYLEMLNLTYSFPRAILETAFVANTLYLLLVLWTLRNSMMFLSDYGPRIFRSEIQVEKEGGE